MSIAVKTLTREKLEEFERPVFLKSLMLAAAVGMAAPISPEDTLSLIQFALWNRDRIEEPKP